MLKGHKKNRETRQRDNKILEWGLFEKFNKEEKEQQCPDHQIWEKNKSLYQELETSNNDSIKLKRVEVSDVDLRFGLVEEMNRCVKLKHQRQLFKDTMSIMTLYTLDQRIKIFSGQTS